VGCLLDSCSLVVGTLRCGERGRTAGSPWYQVSENRERCSSAGGETSEPVNEMPANETISRSRLHSGPGHTAIFGPPSRSWTLGYKDFEKV
jgi:hypothetical protein